MKSKGYSLWSLGSKAKKFLHSRKFSDVMIRVRDRTFHCHRVALAVISEYFDAMLGGVFIEARSSLVTLQNIDAVSFEAILEYAYTGKLPEIDNDNICDLLQASDFLGVDELRNACHIFIGRNLEAHSAPLMNIPWLCNFIRSTERGSSLEWVLEKYILTHLATFTQTEAFLEMPHGDLRVLLRKLRQSSPTSVPYPNENFLLDGLIRWLHHAYGDRKRYFRELIEVGVDFEKVSTEYARFLAIDYNLDPERPLNDLIPLMKTTVIERETPPAPYHQPLLSDKKATIHIYKSVPLDDIHPNTLDDYAIFSLHEQKTQPDWYLSNTFTMSVKPFSFIKGRPLTFIASEKFDFIYSLEHDVTDNGDSEFSAYSHIDFSNPIELNISSPMCNFRNPALAMNDDRIYLYNRAFHAFNYTRSARIWDCKDLSVEEYKRGIYCYERDIDAWFPVPALKRKLAYAGVVTDSSNNLLYLVGGEDSDLVVPPGYVQAYDHRCPTWLEVCKSAHSYYHETACCSKDGKIYVTNGAEMEVFDHVAGRWDAISLPLEMMSRRQWSQVWIVPYESGVYLFHKQNSVMCILDTGSREWSRTIPFGEAIHMDEELNMCNCYHGVQNVIVFRSNQAWECEE